MNDMELRFAGSVPASYDRLLVPLLFRPYAKELARRARSFQPGRILETAAGTGVVTGELQHALPDAEIIATDLNQPMLDLAQEHVGSDKVKFQQVDAQELPFLESSFDLVVCQFGAMFFPDKLRGHSEARRVLRGGGRYLLAIWDAIERNVVSAVTQQALIDLFPDDPPLFLSKGPFGYADPQQIERDLRGAGFRDVEIDTLELTSRSSSAGEAAQGLCYGSPLAVEIEDREAGSLERAFGKVEQLLGAFEGPDGISVPMAAHIVTAVK